MLKRSWLGLFLSLLLGMAGITLLFLVSVPDAPLLFPESGGVISLILVLILAVLIALFLLIREALRRVWLAGAEQMTAKALGEHQRFLKRLDHELKNPLTALRAGLASLTLTLQDAEQRQLVQTLADEAQRLSRLVADLRKVAELDTLMLDLQAIKVSEFCRNLMALVEDRCASLERQVEIGCLPEIDDETLLVGDSDLLLLAVHNLLDNAIKYTQRGDLIGLKLALASTELSITLSDSGIGIPENEQLLVWEELYRGKNASGIQGSGIGLALVKAIVERHNGHVSLESQVGTGTLVTLYLPLN